MFDTPVHWVGIFPGHLSQDPLDLEPRDLCVSCPLAMLPLPPPLTQPISCRLTDAPWPCFPRQGFQQQLLPSRSSRPYPWCGFPAAAEHHLPPPCLLFSGAASWACPNYTPHGSSNWALIRHCLMEAGNGLSAAPASLQPPLQGVPPSLLGDGVMDGLHYLCLPLLPGSGCCAGSGSPRMPWEGMWPTSTTRLEWENALGLIISCSRGIRGGGHTPRSTRMPSQAWEKGKHQSFGVLLPLASISAPASCSGASTRLLPPPKKMARV